MNGSNKTGATKTGVPKTGAQGGQALLGTRGAATTQAALPLGNPAKTGWSVGPDYVPLDDAAMRRSSEWLFVRQPLQVGAMAGFGASAVCCALMLVCFLTLSVTAAAIGTIVVYALSVLLSLLFVPKLFEKLNDAATVKLFKDAEIYISGYFYGWGFGSFVCMVPVAGIVLLFVKR